MKNKNIISFTLSDAAVEKLGNLSKQNNDSKSATLEKLILKSSSTDEVLAKINNELQDLKTQLKQFIENKK